MKSVDVLIVGAGPSGLMLANLLSLRQISYRIIDSNDGPAKESRALGIQAKTLELMQNIGLVEKFLKLGLIAKGAEMYLNGKKRLSIDVADMQRADTPYPYLFMLSQRETEKILIDALKEKGVEVERRTCLKSFRQAPDEIEAQMTHPDRPEEKLSAKYIMGCDGAHSAVRSILNLPFKGESYASEFIMSDSKVHADLALDKVSVFLETGAVAVIFPLQGNQLSRVLTVRRYAHDSDQPPTETTTSAPATLQEIQKNFELISRRDVKLTDAAWVTKYHVHHRSVRQTQVGRAFLLGDASHIHSPLGAQGMNTGLQDAANLAWKLAAVLKEEASESLLSTYHSERWPIGQHLLKFTDRVFTMVITKNPIVGFARDLLLPAVGKFLASFPGGKRYMFRFISQLEIRYHPSEAVQESVSNQASEKFKKTLPAGHRAPNAKINSKLEVFDFLVGYQFHFLVLSQSALSAKDVASLRQNMNKTYFRNFKFQEHWVSLEKSADAFVHQADCKEIFDRYGVTARGIFLIRPDGHIGFRAD